MRINLGHKKRTTMRWLGLVQRLEKHMTTATTARSAGADPLARAIAAAPIAAPRGLQSLLVHVDAGPHAEARIRVARSLADRSGASVTACYAATPLIARMSIGIDGMTAASVFGQLDEIDRSRRNLALARIEQLRTEPGAPLEWQEARGMEPIRSLARRALYADLLVLGQHDPSIEDCGIPADFVESVVIQSGIPALVVPYIRAQQTVGTRVLVAWKETASTARALRAALPLLDRAEEVHVVSWGAEEDSGVGPGAVTAFLQQHGIESRLNFSAEQPSQVGERLLSMAADVSADLLVMGCYGHSRARELVLGGATRSILASMTLPVLMAH